MSRKSGAVGTGEMALRHFVVDIVVDGRRCMRDGIMLCSTSQWQEGKEERMNFDDDVT